MTTLMDRLRPRLRKTAGAPKERRAALLAEYETILRRIANDNAKPADESRLVSLLEELPDLDERWVELHLKAIRKEEQLAAQAAAMPQIEADIAKTTARIVAINRQLKALFKERVDLVETRSDLEQQQRAGREADKRFRPEIRRYFTRLFFHSDAPPPTNDRQARYLTPPLLNEARELGIELRRGWETARADPPQSGEDHAS